MPTPSYLLSAMLIMLAAISTIWTTGCAPSPGARPNPSASDAASHPMVEQPSAVSVDPMAGTGEAASGMAATGNAATDEPTRPNAREPKPADEPAAAAPGDDDVQPNERRASEVGSESENASNAERSVPLEPAADAAQTSGDSKIDGDANATRGGVASVVPTATSTDGRVVSGDWPCWGGDIQRNMANATTGIGIDFEPAPTADAGRGLLWVAQLGSQTYGNPVVADGKVYVGTNNSAGYRPRHRGDRGCLLCFDAQTGRFLWQLTREKLPQGRANDWPDQGICSAPFVEGDRMWLVTNRCELICLDTAGFYDHQNDGPYTDEPDAELQDADIVWVLDMIGTLGVFPHNLATSSPIVVGDLVYVLTSNGVDESHVKLPAPDAPSFIAVNKLTGEIAWTDNSPRDAILHGQWSSPAAGMVNGRMQVYFPAGNGWLYALDARTGEHIWRFDLNPKDAKWELGGRGTRNSIVATPVFFENSVILGGGQDPEHGDGIGHLYRIDATRQGDVSPMTPDNRPNPNSAQIWHWGGIDPDGTRTGEKGGECFRRTLSTVAIRDGLVYAPDLSGRIHCVDFATGQRYWEADVFATVWGSPMVADGKLFLGDEDGILSVFATGRTMNKLAEIEFPSSIYSTPTISHGVMYVSDRSRLYAIATQAP